VCVCVCVCAFVLGCKFLGVFVLYGFVCECDFWAGQLLQVLCVCVCVA